MSFAKWWHIFAVPEPRRMRQKGWEFKTNLSFIGKLCIKEQRAEGVAQWSVAAVGINQLKALNSIFSTLQKNKISFPSFQKSLASVHRPVFTVVHEAQPDQILSSC